MQGSTVITLTDAEVAAYEAPFPDKSYKLALKKLPSIFPVSKETEGYEISLKAEEWWKQKRETFNTRITRCDRSFAAHAMQY